MSGLELTYGNNESALLTNSVILIMIELRAWTLSTNITQQNYKLIFIRQRLSGEIHTVLRVN